MKKFTCILALCLLCAYGVHAGTSVFHEEKPYPQMTWQEQITAYLSQKKVFRHAHWEGVVLLSFQVTADNRLTGIVVHTSNERLKANLLNQLTGKKLHGSHSDPQQKHTIRLRFHLTDKLLDQPPPARTRSHEKVPVKHRNCPNRPVAQQPTGRLVHTGTTAIPGV